MAEELNNTGSKPLVALKRAACFAGLLLVNPYLLTAANAVFITSLVFIQIFGSYEDRLYDNIVERTWKWEAQALGVDELTDEQKVLSLLNAANTLAQPRYEMFVNRQNTGFRESWFASADYQLMEAAGACGSYTHVFVRLLQRAGYPARVVQMQCGEQPACHIIAETKIGDRWIAVDCQFNLVFRRPDGELASFEEIGDNWSYYQAQVPEDYIMERAYEGVRRTNWDKIPVVMPAIKWTLDLVLGEEEANQVSLRSHMMNVYWVWRAFLILAWAPILLLTGISVWYHQRRGKSAG